MLEPLFSVLSPLWAATNAVARLAKSPRGEKFSVPVISVGNILAGGVGKTEISAAIAAKLIARGKRVVVASRGYGSSWQKTGGIATDLETAVSLRFPDEALVLLKKVPGIMVSVGWDRVRVLKRYWEELQPDVILLDDGLQHFAIRRDLDIVVHDFSVRFPILRDFPSRLLGSKTRVSLSEVPPEWRKKTQWVRARYKLTGTFDGAGQRYPLPQEALAFCGLGNPTRFKAALERSGVVVRGFREFSDHARYGVKEANEISAWRKTKGQASLPLLTTLKDYVKLDHDLQSRGGVAGFEPRWVSLDVEFLENEDLFWSAIDAVLAVRTS